MNIILPKTFDVSAITFGAVRTQESGGKSIYIAYNGRPLVLQTPKCIAPFGISKWSDDRANAASKTTTNDKFSLELSFKGFDEEGSSMKAFFDSIVSIDSLIKANAIENSLTWFNKKKLSQDSANDSFTSPVKYHMDNGEASTLKYAPRIRISVPMDREGNFTCHAFINRVKVQLTQEMTKNCNITAIIRGSGIWIISSRYGITYKLEQLLVEPRSDVLERYAFVDVNDDKKIEDAESDEIDDTDSD